MQRKNCVNTGCIAFFISVYDLGLMIIEVNDTVQMKKIARG